jgi:hypothetical protein
VFICRLCGRPLHRDGYCTPWALDTPLIEEPMTRDLPPRPRYVGLRMWKDPKTGEVLATSLLKDHPGDGPRVTNGLLLLLQMSWDALFRD